MLWVKQTTYCKRSENASSSTCYLVGKYTCCNTFCLFVLQMGVGLQVLDLAPGTRMANSTCVPKAPSWDLVAAIIICCITKPDFDRPVALALGGCRLWDVLSTTHHRPNKTKKIYSQPDSDIAVFVCPHRRTRIWCMSLFRMMVWLVSSKLAQKQTRTIRTTSSGVSSMLIHNMWCLHFFQSSENCKLIVVWCSDLFFFFS
jgi:hypothetical protein